jgi:hypothetical protein
MPDGIADQAPHKQDELFLIASGAADPINGEECVQV